MANDDQIWNLIERLTRLEEQVAALAMDGDTPGGGDVRLGKTTRIGATYPTGAGDYYAISPALPTGTEVEGTAAGTSDIRLAAPALFTILRRTADCGANAVDTES